MYKVLEFKRKEKEENGPALKEGYSFEEAIKKNEERAKRLKYNRAQHIKREVNKYES